MHTKVPKVYMKLLLPEAPFGSSALILAGLFPSCRLFFLPSLFPRSQYSDTVVPFSSAISIVSTLIGRWEILEGEQNVNLF